MLERDLLLTYLDLIIASLSSYDAVSTTSVKLVNGNLKMMNFYKFACAY